MALLFLDEYKAGHWSAMSNDQEKIFVKIEGNSIHCAVGKTVQKNVATIVCRNGAHRWTLDRFTFFCGQRKDGTGLYISADEKVIPTDDPWGDTEDGPNDDIPF